MTIPRIAVMLDEDGHVDQVYALDPALVGAEVAIIGDKLPAILPAGAVRAAMLGGIAGVTIFKAELADFVLAMGEEFAHG